MLQTNYRVFEAASEAVEVSSSDFYNNRFVQLPSTAADSETENAISLLCSRALIESVVRAADAGEFGAAGGGHVCVRPPGQRRA